jgi:hypothetical protein
MILLPKIRLRRKPAAGLFLVCVAIGAQAKSTCPNWVVTPAGSAFNVAALISDNGSPGAALAKARNAVERVNKGGGCESIADDPAACHETIALAKKAIAALEECQVPNAKTKPAPKTRPAVETENDPSP